MFKLNPIGECGEGTSTWRNQTHFLFTLLTLPTPVKMKRRITYIQGVETPFGPRQASLTPSALTIRDLDAAREDRVTFGLDELPEEVSVGPKEENTPNC